MWPDRGVAGSSLYELFVCEAALVCSSPIPKGQGGRYPTSGESGGLVLRFLKVLLKGTSGDVGQPTGHVGLPNSETSTRLLRCFPARGTPGEKEMLGSLIHWFHPLASEGASVLLVVSEDQHEG